MLLWNIQRIFGPDMGITVCGILDKERRVSPGILLSLSERKRNYHERRYCDRKTWRK